jgi:HEAT repeat protein
MKSHRWISLALSLLTVAPLAALGGELTDDDQEVRQLVQKLKSKDAKERAQAADDLSSIGKEAKSAVTALIELNKDKDWYVRTRAVMAMGAIGKDLKGQGPEAMAIVRVLLESLKDTKAADNERFEVCQEILKALGEIGSREEGGHAKTIVPAVLPLLKHKDGFVRGKAADALSESECKDHAKAAVPTLVQMLKDSHDYPRKSAIQALREIDPETAKKHGIE